MKLKARIRNLLFDPALKLNERVFILLTLVALAILAVALIGDLIYNHNLSETFTIMALMVVVPAITYAGIRTHKLDLVIKITSVLIMVVIPVIFFQAGGAEGAAILWFAFYYLFIGLVLTGWWRIFNLVLFTVMVFAMFVIGYYHPELFKPYTRWIFYLDTSLAVVEIGFICFIMTWFQNRQFIEENNRAKEETRKVEELNRSQNRFFSSMSHEIRTPINSILGLNEIILRQDDASAEIVKDAENIQGAGNMLLALINDILDFSKIEAGKMDIVPVNYSIANMLSEIVNMVWLRAEQKGLEFRIEVDPTIPSELFGDEVRIKQILVNLLNNAVKYTREGSVTLHIEKEELREDEVLLMFSVIDTGMGIKQDEIPYLFDAFRRVDEEKNARIEGTGLGLSIVKQLVDLMGGRITVNSVYTQGSTFMVSLWQQVTRSDAVGEINITNDSCEGSEGRYLAGFMAKDTRILIVDDNRMNLEVEKKLLDGTEITVDTVMSGEEALSMTLSFRYDVILMDHLMPEMDGIVCMQLIRKQSGGLNNSVPIVVLTANADSEHRDIYSRSGFDGYLIKPVSGRQLRETVLRYLPENRIVRNDAYFTSGLRMNSTGSYTHKIPILVASSTTCDIPVSVISGLQIDTIPYNIHVDGKTFYDSVEAGADEVLRYMKSGMEFSFEPPSVDEFESFFGRELKKAHNVIYIAVSSRMNNEYERAMTAAKAYGNVKVFDSGSVAGGTGLFVLLAHRLSLQGRTPEKIIEELEAFKQRVHISYITDGSHFVGRKDLFGRTIYSFIKVLNIHPFVRVEDGRSIPGRVIVGEDRARNFEKYIDLALPRFIKPESDVLMVLYSDMTDDEHERIESRIRKRYDFENIIFKKASVPFALGCGAGSLGIVYVDKGEQELKLSQILVSNKEGTDYEAADALPAADIPDDTFAVNEPENIPVASETDNIHADGEPEAQAWYETIPGIDWELAMENCGGDEELMKEMFRVFYDSISEKSEEIQSFYNKEDWENYTIRVHALKSSARLVGAEKLADDALALEKAGKEGNVSYIKEHTDSLVSDYLSYEKGFAFLFAADTEKKQADSVIIDIMYDTLREAIGIKDASAIKEAFDEIAQYELPTEDELKLDQLKDLFDAGDYESMSVIIDI